MSNKAARIWRTWVVPQLRLLPQLHLLPQLQLLPPLLSHTSRTTPEMVLQGHMCSNAMHAVDKTLLLLRYLPPAKGRFFVPGEGADAPSAPGDGSLNCRRNNLSPSCCLVRAFCIVLNAASVAASIAAFVPFGLVSSAASIPAACAASYTLFESSKFSVDSVSNFCLAASSPTLLISISTCACIVGVKNSSCCIILAIWSS